MLNFSLVEEFANQFDLQFDFARSVTIHHLHPNISLQVLHTGLYTFPISHNQKLVMFLIISFILTTIIYDPRLVLLGEIRCLSFSGVKGLTII